MIYLIGPYTSSSVLEHRANIGRLYAYYTLLHKDQPDIPIICWPLMTAGFEQIFPEKDAQWIEFCLQLLRSGVITKCYAVPGWECSSGCQMEMNTGNDVGLYCAHLLPLSYDQQEWLMRQMMFLRNRNEFARWAMQWLAIL